MSEYKLENINTDAYACLCVLRLNNSFVLYPWALAPQPLKDICNFNGGDEDYMIITRKELLGQNSWWIDKISNDYDQYEFEDFVIFVCSHS